MITYPGPLNAYPHIPRFLASYFLPFFLGDRYRSNDSERDSCDWKNFSADEDQIYSYVWMRDLFGPDENETVCVRSTVKQSLAKSPAFDAEGRFDIKIGVLK